MSDREDKYSDVEEKSGGLGRKLNQRSNTSRRRALIRRNAQSEQTAALDFRQGTPSLDSYLRRLGDQGTVQDANRDGRRRGLPDQPGGDRRMPHAEAGVQPPAEDAESNARHLHASPVSASPPQTIGADVEPVRISTEKWGYYFAAKFGLFWYQLIDFHLLENLAFAVFVLFVLPSGFWFRIKTAVSVMIALCLLYYDSWLPAADRVVSRMSSLADFNSGYLIELMIRFVNLQVLAVVLAVCFAYWAASRLLKPALLIIAGILLIWLMQSPVLRNAEQTFSSGEIARNSAEEGQSGPDMDKVMQSFFDKEMKRSVQFTAPPSKDVPFDVVFIHVCSLSWDDVRAVGLEQHPLWRRFDILLKRFNSAASYSGPAAIHLLRATCGQQAHGKMYLPVPDNCYLLGSLQTSGFEPQFALNHKGNFDSLLEQMKEHGRISVPLMSQDGLETVMYGFNNDAANHAPIYDDFSVLDRWLSLRKNSSSPRVALFYNSASLHDGNYYPGSEAVPNTLKTYKLRLQRFLDEMERFMQRIDASGRRAVVVMVPEHGGAVRGDNKQMAGLREIPTPGITLVPVGIKVIGGHIRRAGDTLSVDEPTSYLAIAHIVELMLKKSPFNGSNFVPSDYISGLPTTEFVAQNEGISIIEHEHQYYISRRQGVWRLYSEFNVPEMSR